MTIVFSVMVLSSYTSFPSVVSHQRFCDPVRMMDGGVDRWMMDRWMNDGGIDDRWMMVGWIDG